MFPTRALMLNAVGAAVVLSMTACEEMTNRPNDQDEQVVLLPLGESFTPVRERLVGFAARFPSQRTGHREDDRVFARVAEEEAARVSAMHRRGGTGAGITVGTFDSGAKPDHPDLAGRFPHVCAIGDCNDGRPNVVGASPRFDTDGHGTQVNGVIAASKNGVGVFGVAHEARIASFGNSALPSDLSPTWDDYFDEQTGRGFDWMRSLGVRITNCSWGRADLWTRESEKRRRLTASVVREMMVHTLKAVESYVGADGVVVWASGNDSGLHPSLESMLPRYFPDLENGWLAVVAVGPTGRIAHFSNFCGDAADWCLAAPGGQIVTTDLDGRWVTTAGTSIAAPYVAAGLAALKSMFPHLSYHQLRARILATADRRPPYDDRRIYGSGRLDLDAASRAIVLGDLVPDP